MAVRDDAVVRLAERLAAAGQRLVTAESCTGGLLASTLTSIPGSSDWFEGAFVTYTIEAKQAMLGVPAELLAAHGAVSEPVARSMATHALERTRASVAVSVTGLAGPTGDGSDNPVGTVWLAVAATAANEVETTHCRFPGGREEVRRAAVAKAVELLHGFVPTTVSP